MNHSGEVVIALPSVELQTEAFRAAFLLSRVGLSDFPQFLKAVRVGEHVGGGPASTQQRCMLAAIHRLVRRKSLALGGLCVNISFLLFRVRILEHA